MTSSFATEPALPRFSVIDALALLLSLASAALLGWELWSVMVRDGPFLLVCLLPFLTGGLWVVWSHRANVRQHPNHWLAVLCAGALFFGLVCTLQIADEWKLSFADTPLGTVLKCCWYALVFAGGRPLTAWCYRRLCRVFAPLDRRRA